MRRTLIALSAATLLAGCATDDTPDTKNNTQTDTGVDAGNDAGEETLDLRSLSPAQGNVAGGTTVTLSGRGFASGMTVKFGDQSGTSVVVLTSRQATVVTPAGAVGAVDVVVTNLDGTNDTLVGAFTYVEAQDPQVGFCQLQAQSPATATIGQDPPALYAVVFMEGVTQGAGQGSGIEGELGWGTGDPAQFDFAPMAYNVDKDGLNAGDLANDEYGAALSIPTTGEFNYVARFRAAGRADWVYCDLDGSENGVDQPGVIQVIEPARPEIDFCQLQAQSPASATTGEDSVRLHAFVYSNGLTPGDGQGSGIEGELGFGPVDGDPETFSYVAMSYNGDIDGPNAGDKANDEYGARLQASVAGTYDYVARFRSGDGQWVYCDLDGSNNGFDAPGKFEVSDPVVPTVGFCKTNASSLMGVVGQGVTGIEGTVFSAGMTPGAGQGAGVLAELRYGASGTAPSTWTEKVTATYTRDADGLSQGDTANDVYTASLPSLAEGSYAFAYRFSVDNGANWVDCDTVGSPPFNAAEVGALDVQPAMVNLPDACKFQFPAIVTSAVQGENVTFYGRVTEAGKTGTGMTDADIKAELLVGAEGLDPRADVAQFATVAGTLRTSGVINPGPNEDEYEAIFTSPAAGKYVVAYRFSVDGGQNWSYCDLDGGAFSRAQAGHISVFDAASAPDLIDYCNIWQSGWSVNVADAAPIATIEAFESGVTDSGNFMPADLDAEVGYGKGNPAIPGTFVWNAMPYKAPRPGVPNNQEYEGAIYTAAPAAGAWDVAVRLRRAGSAGWVYCDANNTTMNYFPSDAAKLTVSQ